MGTYNFDKEMFVSLAGEDLIPGFNSIGMGDLDDSEQTVMWQFLGYLGQPVADDVDPDNVLLVKANSIGIITKVYGASLFKSEEHGLILKTGGNEFKVTQTSSGFKVGELEGTIEFAEKAIAATVKDSAGEEKEVDFWPAVVSFMPEDGEEIEYKVRCAWDASKEAKPATIKSRIKKGDSILDFFSNVPTGAGGTEAIKMQELGDGIYDVKDIRQIPTGSFILILDDGREVWSRGGVDIQLKDGYQLRPGVICKLLVSDCKQRKDGKWGVTCALREYDAEGNPIRREKKAVKPPTPKLATVGATSAPASAETDLEDIAF